MNRLNFGLVTVALVLIPACLSWADEKIALVPVPDADAQMKAEKLIKEVFQADYSKAKLPTDKAALAEKLLRQGGETKDDLTARFVMFREARDLAAESGAIANSLKAVDEIAKSFLVDALEMKTDALVAADKAAPMTSKRAVADAAQILIDDAVRVDNFEVATRLAKVALSSAQSSKDFSAIQKAVARVKEVEDARTTFAGIKPSLDALKLKPADPDANLAVGKYFCFVKGQWEKGVVMLALGKDSNLKKLSEKELASPTEYDKQLELGDAWWDYAGQASQGKARIQVRAAHWYRLASPKLTGLNKAKAEKRVAEVDELLAKGIGAGDSLEERLKKLFHGKTTYNRGTGVLTLEYDFTGEEQLADFEKFPESSQAVLKSGTLSLPKNVQLSHIAKFRSLTLKAKVKGNESSDFFVIANPPSYHVHVHDWENRLSKPPGRGITLKILTRDKKSEEVHSQRYPKGDHWQVEIAVTDKFVRLKVEDIVLTKTRESVLACRPILNGGVLGNSFSKLVLEGTLDEEWVKQVLAGKE